MKDSIFNSLFEKYNEYEEEEIHPELITHGELLKHILTLEKKKFFGVEKIGESIEKRGIYSLTIGKGKTKVLCWSQMHGDEPTATAALFDLFNFLSADDSFNEFRKKIISELEIHFIPMVNPDGAERYQRENAINIDINRDALTLESDESKVLWNYAEKLKPEFGFNLHDQNSYYTAGRTNKTSAISMLAPPMDYVKSINYTREKSMQVILKINEILSQFIPGYIARYSDDFEPRAFGDNFVKLGISSILIESGFYPGDYKKDFLRKLNFISLLTAFNSITERDHEKLFYADYFEIPENKEMLFDLLLRNLKLYFADRFFNVDIGINRKKKFNSDTKEFYYEGEIAAIGDLSIFFGIQEHDLSGFQIQSSKPLAIDSSAEFELIKDGKTVFKIINGILEKISS